MQLCRGTRSPPSRSPGSPALPRLLSVLRRFSELLMCPPNNGSKSAAGSREPQPSPASSVATQGLCLREMRQGVSRTWQLTGSAAEQSLGGSSEAACPAAPWGVAQRHPAEAFGPQRETPVRHPSV